ncbi:MAG: transglycosylase SLT domain-containing protein [Bdellovibrionales bacterium]|nr:transglycosylase SLT domain-containing protein [Bdellovibrionales bacterium]
MPKTRQYSNIITTLSVTLILLQTHVFAKTLEEGFFTTFGGHRYITVDLSTIKAQDPLGLTLTQNIPNSSPNKSDLSQNQFILSYVHAIRNEWEQAQKYADLIPKENQIYALAQYYVIHFLVRSDKLRQESGTQVIQHQDHLRLVMFQLPKALNYDVLVTSELLEMYRFIKVEKEQITNHFIDQLFNHLQSGKIPTKTKIQSILDMHKRILPLGGNIQNHFNHYLQTQYNSHSEIQKIFTDSLPSKESKQETPFEKTASSKLEKAKNEASQGQYPSAIQTFVDIFSHYTETQTYEKAQTEFRNLLKRLTAQPSTLESLIVHLQKLPPDLLYSEGRFLWNQDENKVSKALFEAFKGQYDFHSSASNVYYMLARMHENELEFEKSRQTYQELANQYVFSEFHERSLFKVGLLSYLLKDYTKAQSIFEDEIETPNASNLRKAQAHYWLYRIFEKTGEKTKAQKQVNSLLKEYPYSYYATIVDQHPSIENKPFAPSKAKESFWIYDIDTFLQVGLHDLVRRELAELDPLDDHEKYRLAEILDHTHFYLYSMNLMYDSFEKTPTLHEDRLKLFFPLSPYTDFFDEKKTYRIPTIVALSIMKQESAFNPFAVSPANAFGLMQLIMPTAKRMAQKHNLQIRQWDLFTPSTNILLGTTYVAENLERFEQNIVDALISYNAGPGRAKEWKNRWGDMPEDVYIEMIPIQETRTYVKLILRNLYFYQRLYPKEFKKTLDFKGLPENFIK